MATLQSKLILSLVDRVTEPARRVEQRMRGLNDRIEKNNRRMAAATSKFATASAAAIGLGAALSAPARAAGNFEEAMADVRKVVDFPTPEAFGKMQSDILNLSKTLPMSVEGLAAIAASAGQAGIAREDIIAFTESAAKIGTAFDITADQAGNAMKALMTGLGQDVDEIGLLFDKMNVLSNNQAATARDITNVVTKVGATAKGFGFAADETAAFASAMLAAGGKADTSATSIRNMGKALSRGASATNRQKDAFAVLGIEATDVAKRMQDDAVGTTIDVLNRINQLPAEMQSAVQSDLFGDEARELSKVRQNMDVVREGLALVGDDAAAAGSANEEFAIRADTLNAKAQLLKNSFERLNIAIGNTFMKSLKGVMERIGRIADAVGRWAEENPKLASGLIKAAGGLVAFNLAFAGANLFRLVLWGGALRTAAAGLRVFGAASAFVKGSAGSALALDAALAKMEGRSPGKIRKVGVALKAVAGATGLGKVATGIGAVAGVIGAISAPVWIGIGAAIATVGAAWKYWDRITAIVSGVASAIGDELQPVMDWIKEKLEPLKPIIEPIGKAFTVLGEGISAAFSAIRDFFTGDIFKREKLGEEEFASIEARSKAVAKTIIDSVKGAFNDFIDWIAGFPQRIIEAIGSINLSDIINWPEPPAWWKKLTGGGEITTFNPVTGAGRNKPIDGAKAGGGPVSAMRSYLVGEEGPEFFTPRRSGVIHTARETARMAARAAAMAPVIAAPPAIQAAASPVTSVVAAPSPISTDVAQTASAGGQSRAPASITFGDIIVQGGANASAEELGQEFGRQVAARMRSQFSDEF
ncbi:phage tail tape measure protein [Sediminimonas qiaohouensis]|uniref:phage tail tape measure protein n=1 Tax=Sediminimonas qiaohouensis TaxID=552061 RepID=UPI00040A341A|nr:phage tail tape measure protein [Sediminimonas qiaohouensis]